MLSIYFNLNVLITKNFVGEWGGIWRAEGDYSLISNNRYQTNVRLVKKFSNWTYTSKGINQRVPYIYKHRLTMSEEPEDNFWGTITGGMQKNKTTSIYSNFHHHFIGKS